MSFQASSRWGRRLTLLSLFAALAVWAGCDSNGDDGGIDELIVEDLVVGTGPELAVGDTATVHYLGGLEPSRVLFDASYYHCEPYTFELGTPTVIEGWNLGLEGMREGGRRRLTIPADLAYGNEAVENALGDVIIPAGSDLLFEIDLLAPDRVTRVVSEDLVEGNGSEVELGRAVSVRYRGRVQGSDAVFDSTAAGAEPFTFIPGEQQLIPGWECGLLGAREGGTRRLVIPPAYAYGERDRIRNGEVIIPGGSTLVFDIEVVDVEAP